MDEKGYRQLIVWQKAMDLVEMVYGHTQTFPASDRFGLASQMEREALSIPSNVAEGYCRSSTKDYLKHLSYARGSLAELETQLIAAVRLKRIERDGAIPAWSLCQEVGKMLTALTISLANKRPARQSAPKPQAPGPNP